MITRQSVSKNVLRFIEDIKQESGLDVAVSEQTVIIGTASQFDSMAFLDLVGLIEEWIDQEFNLFISIASDDEDFEPEGPFGNVQRLTDYLTDLINKEKLASKDMASHENSN